MARRKKPLTPTQRRKLKAKEQKRLNKKQQEAAGILGKLQRATFLDHPLRDLQRLAVEVYGEGSIVTVNNAPNGVIAVLDTLESMSRNESAITIHDPDAQEMLWATLKEKKLLMYREAKRIRARERNESRLLDNSGNQGIKSSV